MRYVLWAASVLLAALTVLQAARDHAPLPAECQEYRACIVRYGDEPKP